MCRETDGIENSICSHDMWGTCHAFGEAKKSSSRGRYSKALQKAVSNLPFDWIGFDLVEELLAK